MVKRFFGQHLYSKIDRLGTYAAALAYSVVLSLVPFLAVTFVIGYTVASHLYIKDYSSQYGQVLSSILPTTDETQHIVDAVIKSDSSKSNDPEKKHERTRGRGLLTVGFLVALYTSYNLMDQMSRTIRFIFDDPRRPSGWSWRTLVKTIFLLLIWMCLLLLISMSAAEGAVLKGFVAKNNFTEIGGPLIAFTQLGVVIGALFATFYLTYRLIPTKAHKTRYVVEGSMLSSTGWILCSLAFASIMPSILKTSAAYIALGSIVAILLWAQMCAWSLILGACWIVRFSTEK